MEKPDSIYLRPTKIIDSDHELVVEYAGQVVGSSQDPVDQAIKLFHAVRDDIQYTPYLPFYLPEHYRASNVLKLGRSFCVGKASLLCALARSRSIPCRIGFATVRNHLATKQLIEYLGGSDVVVYHGYNELYLEGRWVKATATFHKELCERHGVAPLEFNGREDSIFHPYNNARKKFMEYMVYHGCHADVPVDEIVRAWEEAYGKERLEIWKEEIKKRKRDFYQEEVLVD